MSKEDDLIKAARDGKIDKVKRLLDSGLDIESLGSGTGVGAYVTPLMAAAFGGHLQIVYFLLERGAKVEKKSFGQTALTKAAMMGHNEIVSLLLERGADPNIRLRGNKGTVLTNWTILHTAAGGFYETHLQVVILLLKHGAEVNAKNSKNKTPLHIASKRGHIEIVRQLLKNDADITIRDSKNRTPIGVARTEEVISLLKEHAKFIEEKKKHAEEELLKQAKEEQVIAQYTSVLTNFQKALEQPKLIDIEYLSGMFQQANDVCMFRFPYTLAIIFRQEAPQLIEKIDTLIVRYLRELAQTYIKGPRVYSIFVKVILKSATKRGIIDKITEGELAKIADNTETLSDQRFAELLHKVDTLQKRVENLEHNIQTLAKEFNGLKEALKRKSKRDAIFGFAKMVLSLVGIQAVDMIAGIADFTDLSSISDVMFGLPIEEIGQGLLANNKMIIKEVTGTLLKKAGLDPNDYLKVWYESHLLLETAPAHPTVIPISYESSISPAHPKLFISTSEEVSDKVTSVALSASPQTLFALKPVAKIALKAVPRDPIPAAASSLPTTSSFEDWLKTVQSFGNFDLNVSEKKLVIQFTSSHKTVSEINKILNTLDEYFEKIPELEQVALDRDIDEHNRLIITTKTTLGAKRLKTILEEQYMLSDNASVAMTSPSTTLASLHI